MSFLLFLAPTGWGKTQKIIEWHREREETIVYLSPLRALCDEFKMRVKDERRVFSFSENEEFDRLPPKSLVIATFEKLGLHRLEILIEKKCLFILDEFHLVYLWGDSFRPLLFEMWMCLATQQAQVIGMTATLSSELRERICLDLENNFTESYCFDQGVNLLKKNPKTISIYPNKKWLNCELMTSMKKRKKPVLLFVAYRQEVEGWLQWARNRGIAAIGCVGGEAHRFSSLVHSGQWQLIVATTVISHGVNLPSVEAVFISFFLHDREFWTQMVGRAGRRGEVFELHHMNYQELSRRKRWTHWSQLYLRFIRNSCFQKIAAMI
ncbi:MAG: hypothetical protein Fur0010_16360 [Bdellovibrio sp.]